MFLLLPFRWVFLNSVSWWSFTGECVPQVFKTLQSILAYLNNAAVWMVSILPLISNCSCLVSKSMGQFQAHQLLLLSSSPCSTVFSSLTMSKYIFASFYFPTVVCRNGKIHKMASSSFFLLIITMSCLLARIKWSNSYLKISEMRQILISCKIPRELPSLHRRV